MLLIDETNAEQYLRASGRVRSDVAIQVRELSGGVSNVVLLVSSDIGRPLFVVKQAREQLRVAEPWFCSVERIWREVEVLEICEVLLGAGQAAASPDKLEVELPRVLFRDADNYLFAMTAAPVHRVLKEVLLGGDCHAEAVRSCGRLLGRLHASTWQNKTVADRLSDRAFFEALRVDPYYRHVARHHPELAPKLNALIESLGENPRCLVHGDFSPKNILMFEAGLMLVDFEVGHFGDPAFDLGFFLTHLVLKAIRAERRWPEYLDLTVEFLDSYAPDVRDAAGQREFASLIQRTVWNFAGCLLARVDGKSKVDYLNASQQDLARQAGRQLLLEPPGEWPGAMAVLQAISPFAG